MMANHPNRAWRAKMRHACDAWLALWRWPTDGAGILTPSELRRLMARSYQAGYTHGRQSTMRPQPDDRPAI